ncbi:uncharacterized protein A4U43_C09F11750 [Asparagus officinalis]|uniref:Peptide chain release factor domain-containing protein n=1 Tax=Asparagus officinalis TaxID=4686 RepID=A0A5P1EA44_ASPOF|nr:uncharacterized protein A4U43_C09F11750 [Asparagus officinalis]
MFMFYQTENRGLANTDDDDFSDNDYEQEKLPRRKGKAETFSNFGFEEKARRVDAQTKWKYVPETDANSLHSDDDLNALLKEEEELVIAHRKQVEDTINIVRECHYNVEEITASAGLERLEADRTLLEKKDADSSLWDDPSKAQETLLTLTDVKDKIKLLSEFKSQEGAVVTITAGAGGTDAWADPVDTAFLGITEHLNFGDSMKRLQTLDKDSF